MSDNQSVAQSGYQQVHQLTSHVSLEASSSNKQIVNQLYDMSSSQQVHRSVIQPDSQSIG